MNSCVSHIAVDRYDLPLLTKAVEKHFSLHNIWNELHPGMRVVFKPNLLARYSPESAVTTHPLVVEAVACVLQQHGISEITIADSPGGPYTASLLRAIYSGCGMSAVAERRGIKLNLDTGFQSRSCTAGNAICREFNIINPVADADYIINLCKLKTHAMVTYSGAVKNLFGCVPGLQKPELHFRFPQQEHFCHMLVDLALTVKPNFTIMDAVIGMEGDGPASGDARAIGKTFAVRNLFALDLAVCDMIGLAPETVATVLHAVRSGLCPTRASQIEWLGEGAPQAIPDFHHPRSKPISFGGHIPRILRRPAEWVERCFLTPHPAVIRQQCIGCGKCAQSCAPKAITLQDGKAKIDRNRCIRCYCCHELCPVHAVTIRRACILNR